MPDSTTTLGIVGIFLLMGPVVLYILDRSAGVVGLSLVSVGLVVASLYLMFGRSEAGAGEHHA